MGTIMKWDVAKVLWMNIPGYSIFIWYYWKQIALTSIRPRHCTVSICITPFIVPNFWDGGRYLSLSWTGNIFQNIIYTCSLSKSLSIVPLPNSICLLKSRQLLIRTDVQKTFAYCSVQCCLTINVSSWLGHEMSLV